MPKLSKQFDLEITVEQFLNACSHLELQEVSIQLDGALRRAEGRELKKDHEMGFNEDLKFRKAISKSEGYCLHRNAYLINQATGFCPDCNQYIKD